MLAAGETNEAARERSELLFRNRTFAFRCAQFHSRDQPAEVLVTFAGFNEQGIAYAGCGCDFGADMSLNPGFDGSEVKARRAEDAIAIEQRHSGHGVFGAGTQEFFG